jgi:hypothetical protein
MFAAYIYYCVGIHISTLENSFKRFLVLPIISIFTKKTSESPYEPENDEETELFLSREDISNDD